MLTPYYSGNNPGQAFWQSYDRNRRSRLAELADERAAEDQRMQREQVRLDRERLQAKTEQDTARQRQQLTANVKNWASRTLQANPNAAPQVQAHIQQLAGTGKIDAFDVSNPAELDVSAGFDSAVAGMDPPKSSDGPQLDAIGKRVVLERSQRPGTPEFMASYRELAAEEERRELERRRAGATNITVGRDGQQQIGLTTSQQTAQQEAVLDARKTLAQLDLVDKFFGEAGGHEAIGGVVEKGKSMVKEGLAATGLAGQEIEKQVAARAKADAMLSGLNSAILNKLSGAAVSDSEWERIKKSLALTDDPPPVRKAKLDAWRTNLQLIESNGVDALLNGIRSGQVTLPGDRQGGGAAQARIRELSTQGKSKAEIGRILEAEGLVGGTR